MDKIVTSGMKIDLHIHSQFSSAKDGAKVKNNTIENIPLLVSKLNQNRVNICAITDHDTFSYDIYMALKKAEVEDNSLKKVLPGVEFSVLFSTGEIRRVVHVIAIFSDLNNDKVKRIEEILTGSPPKDGLSYTEEDFLEILRKIDVDTVLIAHQKGTLTSQKTRKSDANSLGEDKFLEFVFTDYFEAYEFKNKRNEVFNKEYIATKNVQESVRLITGTDCHEWNNYPYEDSNDISDGFPYTYAKCLPTFKGLVMAITDHRRLKTENSFFNVDRKFLECIKIKFGAQNIEIPLSRGINVIIGDNSIGKSMLLHVMTKYSKKGQTLGKPIREGYLKYLKQNEMEIVTTIPQEDVFCFDMQGEVRAKFEENTLKADKFLGDYFATQVDPKPYRSIVENEIMRMIEYLQAKFALDRQIGQLEPYTISIIENNPESLTFLSNLQRSKRKTGQLIDIISKIESLIVSIGELSRLSLDKSDIDYVTTTITQFQLIKDKYMRRKSIIEEENGRIEKVAKVIANVRVKHQLRIGDDHKKYAETTGYFNQIKMQLIDIITKKNNQNVFTPMIESRQIIPNINRVYDYEFISKLKVERIDTGYFINLVNSLIRSRKSIDWSTITEEELQNLLLRYDSEIPVLDFIHAKLKEKLDNDFDKKIR